MTIDSNGVDERVRRPARVPAGGASGVATERPAGSEWAGADLGSTYDQLVARDWLTPGAAGAHHYSGLFLELFLALDLQFRRESLRLDVEEYRFPALIPIAALATSGYLSSFPQHAGFVCHLPDHSQAVEDFRSRLKTASGTPASAVDACCALAGPGSVEQATALAPTVCYHFFHRHAGRRLKPGQFLTATGLSPCFRREGQATHGLRHLREFNLREMMVLGPAAIVRSWRELLLETQRRLIERCQIRAVVQSASDLFFIDGYEKKRQFPGAVDLKQEVRAWLPEASDGMAIGSVNHHQDFFGHAFNISFESGELAHSACLGVGLDRWCFAVFAQHGLQSDRWPASLRGLLEEYRAVLRSLRDSPGRIHP